MSKKARMVAAVEGLLAAANAMPDDIAAVPRAERLPALLRFADAEKEWDDAVDEYLSELPTKGADE